MKITVVTATWNSAATLEWTLESVLAQSHRDIEHIIVDGKSEDGTIAIVERYVDRYREAGKELKWISEPDHGLYDAMNKGISMATGEIVGILNSDDFYTTDDVLSRVAVEIADVDAVYADIHYVDPEDLTRCVRYYSSKDCSRMKMRMGYMPAHPSFYCRRQIYQKFGLFDLDFKIAADFELLFRLIYIHQIKTRYIDADFVTMRVGGASNAGMDSHRQIMIDHLNTYSKNIPDRP
nr:glycosyltransferase [Muribaculaceae bacterium]